MNTFTENKFSKNKFTNNKFTKSIFTNNKFTSSKLKQNPYCNYLTAYITRLEKYAKCNRTVTQITLN